MFSRASVFLVLLFSACASPAPVVQAPAPPPAPEAQGPAFEVLTLDGGDIALHTLRDASAAILAPATGSVAQIFPSPGGDAVAFVVAGPDSSRLMVFRQAARSLDRMHSARNPVTYTLAWAPDGEEAAFGYYRPTTRDSRPAMGQGGIRLIRGSESASVGCSASRAVLAWLPGDALLVRNTDNLYVVARNGCGTRSTVDARRMHALSASPDGSHLVYVHRELVYNRSRRAYEPDSTFMISEVDGSNARAVVGFRYDPERFAWNADGSELAYDVTVPDMGSRRAISIFDVASATSAYLHPPASSAPSEWDARWSPGSAHAVFWQGEPSGNPVLALRSFASRFPVVLPDSEGAEPAGWMGADLFAYRSADGVLRAFDASTESVVEMPPVGRFIAGWPVR